ncbi:type II secretion system F family protein [Candidatus Pacearchaeota archaeon]|nr:type II secretion system F family protein [Candidatus Pacearchaeota archaeon]
MSIEQIKLNITQEKSLLARLEWLFYNSYKFGAKERSNFNNAMASTINQIKILNNSLPVLIGGVSLIKRLPSENKPAENTNSEKLGDLVSVSYKPSDIIPIVNYSASNNIVAIKKSERQDYLKELHISESYLKNIKKKRKIISEFGDEFKKPNPYVVISNKIFLKLSNNFIDKGYFGNLKNSLKKGNFTIIINSYISVMFFTAFLALLAGLLLTVFLTFFGISLTSPYIYPNPNPFIKLIQTIWIIPLLPVITFLILYFYPSTEKSTIEKNIDYELPFVTVQMAAIAGSDIEPSNIFRIIALSKEYPYVKREAKKLMNQINLYGYDLINALRNVAMASPSKSWAEMLNGMSTTIRSGGDLSKYLNKRAETLLFEYKLKREKATKAAETFMNIYISVVIAAPMLMMLLLIMLSISNIGLGLPMIMITIIIVSIVALINIIFLVFLHLNKNKI